ncbi:MAG: hypothetical protein KIT54_09505 [Phycisphaeraceae bacterium]|nr:hypothetical protein [Phycisphaeraceae bacterium]
MSNPSFQHQVRVAVQRAIGASSEAQRLGLRVADEDEIEYSSAGLEVPIQIGQNEGNASELEDALRALQRVIDKEFPGEYINLFIELMSSEQ